MISYARHEDIDGSGGVTTFVLTLGTGWMWVVILMLQPLFPQENWPRYRLKRGLLLVAEGGRSFGRSGEKTNLLAPVGIRTPDPLIHILVTTVSRRLYFYWSWFYRLQTRESECMFIFGSLLFMCSSVKAELRNLKGGPVFENLVLSPRAVCSRRRMVKNITVAA
jgi:hypothetical protein